MPADLYEDHRAILALADELLAAAQRVPPLSADELTPYRSRLGARAAQHLREEDAQIVRPLLGSGRADELPGAQAVIIAIREARARYSNHVGRWTPAAIQANREGYIEAVADLIEELRPRLVQEERDLYTPVLRLLREEAARSGPGDGGQTSA